MKITDCINGYLLVKHQHVIQFWWPAINEVLFSSAPLDAYSDLSRLVAVWHVTPKNNLNNEKTPTPQS